MDRPENATTVELDAPRSYIRRLPRPNPMDYFVKATVIRRWADELAARHALPQVLRRLVFATVKNPKEVDFPAYESAQRSGFDGEVECSVGNSWVPDDYSVWEVSTNKDVKGKADDDLTKRTAETEDETRSHTTYVALTLRHWEEKKAWAEEHRKSGQWKDIRAYDADDLEQWAETAPTVATWFGRLLGTRPEGVDDIDAKWEMLSGSATKQLVPAVFVASREKELEKLKDWVTSEPSVLHIKTRSPAEGIDFFTAYVASLDPKERDALASRCIVIESESAWKALRDESASAILVVDPSISLSSEDLARAVQHGHYVLVCGDLMRGAPKNTLELGPAGQFELGKALRSCGFAAVEAEQLARASAGSLAILKRRVAKFANSFVPTWASACPIQPLRAALLVGGWDNSNQADRSAIERLAGMSYSELEPHFHKLSKERDPLLLHADKKWRVVSKDEAWSIFGDRITAADLEEFEKIAIEVLTDDDPRFDLEGDRRHLAPILEQIPKYSKTIKEHIAQVLAMLGALGDRLQLAMDVQVTAIVDKIIRRLLPPNVPWQRWASLDQYAPMLAEASPREWLRAVKDDVARPEPELLHLLEDEGGGLFGRCNHSGLLWALESLAWSRENLLDVCVVLLGLAYRDPGKRWSNRPKNSLAEILCGWIPHTTATASERLQVLDRLIAQSPDTTWPLLLELLPGARHVSHPTHKPYWRNWALDWIEGTTISEYHAFGLGVGQRVLFHCQGASRLVEVLNRLGHLPEPSIAILVDHLRTFGISSTDDIQRRAVYDALNSRANWYRRRDPGHKALDQASLISLEAVLPSIQPRSAVYRNAWLFESYPGYFLTASDDVKTADEKLEAARQSAIQEIVEESGFDGLKSLAIESAAPHVVGWMVATVVGDRFLNETLPLQLAEDEKVRQFADTYFGVRFHASGSEWTDRLLAQCETVEAKARLLTTFPFGAATWKTADNLGADVRERYWRLCGARNPGLETADIELACRNLLEHRRVLATVDLVQSALYQKKHIGSSVLCDILEAIRTLSANEVDSPPPQDLSFTIALMVTELQGRENVDEVRLASLELALIDALDEPNPGKPRTLQRLLSSHPEVFSEALAACYPHREEDDFTEWTETDYRRQEHARKILNCLDSLPGKEPSGEINEEHFRAWCTQLRAIAAAGGRLELCDSCIGKLIVHAPADSDGCWPSTPVRRVLEEIATEDLADGIGCGIHNSRGVVCRGEDGQQERDLAAKYRTHADRIRFTSPFVARVLDDVAASYEHEARTWDERGKWEER